MNHSEDKRPPAVDGAGIAIFVASALLIGLGFGAMLSLINGAGAAKCVCAAAESWTDKPITEEPW